MMDDGNTIRLKVRPDVSNNPRVHLDDRDVHAEGRKKIRWEKDDTGEDFDFIALAPDTAPHLNPFKNIDINKNRIKCDFEPAGGSGEYAYMLVIEYQDVAYDTNDDENPNLGRAVIRN